MSRNEHDEPQEISATSAHTDPAFESGITAAGPAKPVSTPGKPVRPPEPQPSPAGGSVPAKITTGIHLDRPAQGRHVAHPTHVGHHSYEQARDLRTKGLKHREPAETAAHHLETPLEPRLPALLPPSGASHALAASHGVARTGLAAALADIREHGLKRPAARWAWYLADTTLQAAGRGASMLAIGTGINVAHFALVQVAHLSATGSFHSFAAIPDLIPAKEVADKALKYAGLALAMEWGGDEALHLVKRKVFRNGSPKRKASAASTPKHRLTHQHHSHDGGWIQETLSSVRQGKFARPVTRLGRHFGRQLGHALCIGGATAGMGELYNAAHLAMSGEKAFTQAGIFGFMFALSGAEIVGEIALDVGLEIGAHKAGEEASHRFGRMVADKRSHVTGWAQKQVVSLGGVANRLRSISGGPSLDTLIRREKNARTFEARKTKAARLPEP